MIKMMTIILIIANFFVVIIVIINITIVFVNALG